MKTIGMIGGMSWESTVPYYKIINETMRDRLGGLHSAKILLYNVDFAEIEALMSTDKWDTIARKLGNVALSLEQAGADFLLICTNTVHKVAPQIQEQIHIPILHIADATAAELKKAGIHKVGLLGTRYTMLEDFYRNRLKDLGFSVLIPDDAGVDETNRIIFEELCVGVTKESSRNTLGNILAEMKQNGAEAVILGCTELDLLITQENSSLPVFDTTVIHARKAAELALQD